MQRQPDADDVRLATALRDALLQSDGGDALLVPESQPSLFEQMLDLIVRTAARVAPSPEGSLFLLNPQRRILTFEVVIGQAAAATKNLTVPLGHGIAGLVAVSGQPLAVANAQQDPRHARDIAEQTGYFPNTILAVPVSTAEGSILGVLELLDRQGAPTYSLDDMELVGRFAQLAALVLEIRRAFTLRSLLVGQTLAAIDGLPPELRGRLETSLTVLAQRIDADPEARRSRDLAARVATIARRGESEQRVCAAVLDAFGTYLAETPEPGAGLELLR